MKTENKHSIALPQGEGCLDYPKPYNWAQSGQKLMRKKSKEDEQILEESVNQAYRRSQAVTLNIKLFLFLPFNKHLINRAKSVYMGVS